MLFRVAVAILKINEAELLECDSVSSVYLHLESMTSRMWHPEKLIKVRIDPINIDLVYPAKAASIMGDPCVVYQPVLTWARFLDFLD